MPGKIAFADLGPGNTDRQLAAFRHGRLGIRCQVRHDLIDLGGIGLDPCRFQRGEHNGLNVIAQQSRSDPAAFNDDGIQVQHARLQHLAAAKGQHLAREGGGALGGSGDFLNVMRGLPGNCRKQQFGITQYHAEQVVELMGYAPGEPSQRFQFFRLAQALLRAAQHHLHVLALAYVTDNGDHICRFAGAVWAQADFYRKEAAIFSLPFQFKTRPHGTHPGAFSVAGAIASVNRPSVLRDQNLNALAGQLGAGIAKHGLRGRIRQSDATIRGNFQDRVRRGFQQLAKSILNSARHGIRLTLMHTSGLALGVGI
jgi:hypothetical protein